MPDAMEIIFQKALLIGTSGAVSSPILFTFKFSNQPSGLPQEHRDMKRPLL